MSTVTIFAHDSHRYTHAATHTDYTFGPNTWKDVPEEVGNYILQVHPNKLCNITGDDDPESHFCDLSDHYDLIRLEEMEEIEASYTPPDNKLQKMSGQKRIIYRKQLKHSRRARLENQR